MSARTRIHSEASNFREEFNRSPVLSSTTPELSRSKEGTFYHGLFQRPPAISLKFQVAGEFERNRGLYHQLTTAFFLVFSSRMARMPPTKALVDGEVDCARGCGDSGGAFYGDGVVPRCSPAPAPQVDPPPLPHARKLAASMTSVSVPRTVRQLRRRVGMPKSNMQASTAPPPLCHRISPRAFCASVQPVVAVVLMVSVDVPTRAGPMSTELLELKLNGGDFGRRSGWKSAWQSVSQRLRTQPLKSL